MQVAKNMDSVFTDAMDNDFDVMFDQEDSLIDTVNGVNEAGDPLTGVDFADLHQTDDACCCKKDPQCCNDEPMGAKDVEGTNGYEFDDNSAAKELDKDSDADKLYDDIEKEYQLDAWDKELSKAKDETDINGIIDKVEESCKKEGCCKEDDGEEDSEVSTDTLEEEFSIEAMDMDNDSPEDMEAEDDDDDALDEAAGDIVDKDVAAVDMDDMDEENDVIDNAIEKDEEQASSDKYSYDPSDEELIDLALNS